MKITHKERLLIQKYLEHYYKEFRESEKDNRTPLSFKNQMQLLYDYTSYIVK